jgi:sirohydrochlorin ferrochelatase
MASEQTLARPKMALTIGEFCRAHNISIAFFYRLQALGQGPRVMRLGTRRLISVEEAQRWRAERTVASASEHEEDRVVA